MKGASMLLVEVQPEELSVHLGSYPGGGEGDRRVEAPGTKAREGGLASVRVATRVKPEQASKGGMGAPNRLKFGEGRRGRSEQPTDDGVISPLLANIYMHRYIRAFRKHGLDERHGTA